MNACRARTEKLNKITVSLNCFFQLRNKAHSTCVHGVRFQNTLLINRHSTINNYNKLLQLSVQNCEMLNLVWLCYMQIIVHIINSTKNDICMGFLKEV